MIHRSFSILAWMSLRGAKVRSHFSNIAVEILSSTIMQSSHVYSSNPPVVHGLPPSVSSSSPSHNASYSEADFVCANCGSTHVVNPSKSRVESASKAHPRLALVDGTMQPVCNRCGLHWARKHKFPPLKKAGRCVNKSKRLEFSSPEMEQAFLSSLTSIVSEEDAQALVCSCGCTYKYFCAGFEEAVTKEARLELLKTPDQDKVLEMLKVRAKALHLRQGDSGSTDNRKKRSPEYVEYIFSTLDIYRPAICYRFLKTLLKFSNSLIYKRPVSIDESGNRTAGKSYREVKKGPKKYSHSLEQLAIGGCCKRNCGVKVHLEQMRAWRETYAQGSQVERWNVIQSMKLSMDRGVAAGRCVVFICGVTGCSRNLCSSVERTMSATGMAGPPPMHKLAKKASVKRTRESMADIAVPMGFANTQPLMMSAKRVALVGTMSIQEVQSQLGSTPRPATTGNVQVLAEELMSIGVQPNQTDEEFQRVMSRYI